MCHPRTLATHISASPRAKVTYVVSTSCLAVLVWKCRQAMNPLGIRLFAERGNKRITRLAESKNICPPVPGFPALPSNMMARIWNTLPGLQTATSLSAVKLISRKWARTIPRST